jgi:2,3-bisphosphoglycerate-dependent phosphoglycerate mutase
MGKQKTSCTGKMARTYSFLVVSFVGILWISFVVDRASSFAPTLPVTESGPFRLAPRSTCQYSGLSDGNFEEYNVGENERPASFRMEKNNGYTGTGGYDPMLSSTGRWFLKSLLLRFPKRNTDKEENEDGWQEMRNTQHPLWRKILRLPLNLSFRALFPKPPVEIGTLILVRHGESLWNANKTFTGWADPDLSERGYREVEHAARLILEGGYEIDVVFTSRLKRAIRSAWIILQEMNQVYLPVFKSWRLNERMYGALTGLCKSETAEQLGAELVQEWRGSLKSRPPALKPSDIYWPGRDRKYADLSGEQIPLTESLNDCMKRCLPMWQQKIVFELRGGKNVLVVAHANTLRGLVKVIDGVSDDDIRDVSIPTG